ncbi:MAG TPA: hypothetical protein EYO58_01250, partial [Flavobacteriales bacterium]|nr:hypothetical protein [Flavobacteriales bacterium]
MLGVKMGTGQVRKNSDSETDNATSVAVGNASVEGSNSDAAAELIEVQIQHSDVSFGEVEGYQQAAMSADQQIKDSDSVFNPLMQYTSMPTRHSDYLLGYCDTEIARTERAES